MAIGFKLKYQQAERRPEILQYLYQRRASVKIIHIVRQNLIGTIVSTLSLPFVFKSFGSANALAETDHRQFTFLTQLDPSTIIRDLCSAEKLIGKARRLISELQILEITYEDLLERQEATCERIINFLGLQVCTPLQSQYRKLLPSSPTECISNLAEIKTILRGTRFEHFVSEG